MSSILLAFLLVEVEGKEAFILLFIYMEGSFYF